MPDLGPLMRWTQRRGTTTKVVEGYIVETFEAAIVDVTTLQEYPAKRFVLQTLDGKHITTDAMRAVEKGDKAHARREQ